MRVDPKLAVVAPPPPIITCEEFAEAYQQGWKKTVRFLMSKGVNSDTAEEIAQDAWGNGWIKSSMLLKREAVLPWVNSIAYNMFRNRIRHQPVTSFVPEQSELPKSTARRFDVSRALESCCPEDRNLLQASAAGYTSHEIARTRGSKPSTVRVKLMRLRRRLERRVS